MQPTPPTPITLDSREMLRAKYLLLNQFALQDQRSYYNSTLSRNKKSARQVNIIRATLAFLTILVSAIITYLVQTAFTNNNCASDLITLEGECARLRNLINTLLVLSVLLPALGAFFNMLSDLFQWQRLVQIYNEATNGINKADALSPFDDMPDDEYRLNLELFANTTLGVMRDEAGQWGQLIGALSNQDVETYRQNILQQYRALEAEKLGESAPGLTVIEPEPDPASPPPPPT